MSKPKKPVRVKLIASLITRDRDVINPVLSAMQERFGGIDFISERMDFDHTEYYNSEMGRGLFRRIASFEDLICLEGLSAIKIFTNSIENQYTDNGRRKINIDPAYVSMEKFVLASCKNFSHRIYLSDGVYADLTLIYKDRNFQPLEWTFPDYAELKMRNLLAKLREKYIMQLKGII